MLPDALQFTSPAPLVDIGANLTHESFEADLEDVLTRARQANVTTLILTGTDREHIQAALTLCEHEHDGVELYTTAGVHPHHADQWDASMAEYVRQVLAQPSTVAAGECGLDYHRDLMPRSVQRRTFEAQLELAAESGQPLFLHEREAGHDMLEMLRYWRDDITRAVVHCFTGERATLHGYLDLDLHIGQTGWLCDERRGQHLREAVNDIPLNRLMVETDCPYLLPRNLPAKLKGRRHEPALLPWIVREIAACRGMEEAELASATTKTARRFFGLDEVIPHG
ncbi:TatD family hydrolase [Kushneria phosphatilytica]|uniref:Hydrolase TatD n=1 Tax=Kushneria phosphatilytica TaxID=657387 RepID=A0A1S1NXY6_9GAMM|nr:TatD family hydrolase [Kushneria phosphatilytica]OHV12328.1 hydrolase TatD [Kushneria phosphatilytica]QEL11534.1 hydrolase TatD [Kushneria phosphatilytica]